METTPKIHFSTIRLPCKSWQRTEDCSIAFHLMSPEPTDFLPTKRQSAYFSCTHQFHVALTEKLFITCFKTFMFVSRSQAKATAPQKQAVLRFLLILKKLLPQKKKKKKSHPAKSFQQSQEKVEASHLENSLQKTHSLQTAELNTVT